MMLSLMKPTKRASLNDEDKKIGMRLRIARIESGLTQAQIASTFDISCQQYQKFEAGVNRVSAKMLNHIAAQLNRPITWFFEELETEKLPNDLDEFSKKKKRFSFARVALRSLQKIENEQLRKHVLSMIQTALEISNAEKNVVNHKKS